jgi:RNA polymerase sigma factor (sigma-70 family)
MDNYQAKLFPYAYNILGSTEDAKDIVQEVITKFIGVAKEGIENEKNYLIRSVINLSINLKNRKKKVVREGDVWLPEPFSTDEADTNIHYNEIVSYPLLILLEKLNPKERAVFILKEAFAYSHEEIGKFLDESMEQSRKLLSRAKMKVDAAGGVAKRSDTTKPLLDKYILAIRNRDLKALENLLTEDITFHADGGGKVKLVASSRSGFSDVSALIVSNYYKFQEKQTVISVEINHQPALAYFENDEVKACQIFEVSSVGKISRINTVLDPDKLKGLTEIVKVRRA